MGALITSGQTKFQIDKSFNKLFVAEQARRTHFGDAIFTSKTAEPGPSYKEGRIAELGIASKLKEGQRPALIVPKEGNSVERFFFKRGLSLMMTEERMDDDIHGTWKSLPGQLNDSIEEAREYDQAAVLELGLTSASTGEDGAVLFSDSHALINSTKTIDNKFPGALSSTTLQAAVMYGKKLIKENGFLAPVRMKGVVIMPDDEWVANDLLKASGRVWDFAAADINRGVMEAATTKGYPAANMRNLLNPSSGMVDNWSIYSMPYLTVAGRWYVLFEGFELVNMWKYKSRLVKDQDLAGTGNVIWTSKARYSVFCNKYRFILGCGTGM